MTGQLLLRPLRTVVPKVLLLTQMGPTKQLKPAEQFSVLAEEDNTYQSSAIRSSVAKRVRLRGCMLSRECQTASLTEGVVQVSQSGGLAPEDFCVAYRLLAVPSNTCTARAS